MSTSTRSWYSDCRKQLRLVNGNYAEMKALDERIREDLEDAEFDADVAVSYEFDADVREVRTHVEFARPSAALLHVAAEDPEAPSPDFVVIRHGKTTALSGGSKMAAEADSVAKVHPACEQCFSELRVLTVGEESTHPGQIAERASDPLMDRLDAPSSPPNNDCVVHAADQGTVSPRAVGPRRMVKRPTRTCPEWCAPTIPTALPLVEVPW